VLVLDYLMEHLMDQELQGKFGRKIRTMEKKTTDFMRIIFFIIFIIGTIVFFLKGERNDKLAALRFNKHEYRGIVVDINYYENRRGFPDYLINGKWIHLGLNGKKIQNHVKINDSLCKKSESDTIQIFRKKEGGEWVLIIER